ASSRSFPSRLRSCSWGLAVCSPSSPGNTYVFCGVQGGYLRRSHFHVQDFKPLLKRAGLPAIHFYALRHSHASLLLTKGLHPKVVQERLGHSQISVNLDIYSHVLPGMQEDAARQLDTMLVATCGENGSNLAVNAG